MTICAHIILDDRRMHRAHIDALTSFGTVTGRTLCSPSDRVLGVPTTPACNAVNEPCGACMVAPLIVEAA